MSSSLFNSQDILPNRVSYDNLPNCTKEDFTAPFKESVGVTLHNRIYISYDEIYWGQTEENPVRVKGSKSSSIRDLATSRKRGIVLSSPRPVVELNNIVDPLNGKTYKYKAENGITRKKADAYNSIEDGGDWYDVVSYQDTENHTTNYNREVFLQLQNDNLPEEVHSSLDIEGSVRKLIASNDLESEEYAIRDFVFSSAPNLRTEEKNEIVRKVIKGAQIPTNTISWRDNECKDWYAEKCVDTSPEIDYFFPNQYFQDRIYAVMKQFWKSGGKVQVIAEHVSNAGGDDPDLIDARRETADKKWDEAEKVFKAVAIHLIANDWKLPVERGRFMPQIKSGDDKEDPNRFVRR